MKPKTNNEVSEAGLPAGALFCVFHGRGGYDCERKSANETLEVGKQYRVVDVEMHASFTYITLEGEKHSYNTAMFDVDFEALYAWAHPPQNAEVSHGDRQRQPDANQTHNQP